MNIVQIGEKHMQAIMETLFDAAYLVTVVTLGCIMVKSAQDRETK